MISTPLCWTSFHLILCILFVPWTIFLHQSDYRLQSRLTFVLGMDLNSYLECQLFLFRYGRFSFLPIRTAEWRQH